MWNWAKLKRGATWICEEYVDIFREKNCQYRGVCQFSETGYLFFGRKATRVRTGLVYISLVWLVCFDLIGQDWSCREAKDCWEWWDNEKSHGRVTISKPARTEKTTQG